MDSLQGEMHAERFVRQERVPLPDCFARYIREFPAGRRLPGESKSILRVVSDYFALDFGPPESCLCLYLFGRNCISRISRA